MQLIFGETIPETRHGLGRGGRWFNLLTEFVASNEATAKINQTLTKSELANLRSASHRYKEAIGPTRIVGRYNPTADAFDVWIATKEA